ncbi:MAG: 16S rRNA (guanine(527)-N(7))-methyltransferase RsmG [Oscillospiraceae bacterium]|jgi:16S rRNA (guanine527-N7)-methyltransferase|nr:16S rRNA (guanine(527)-N(7))-methyltransferase RsmG [Oscillospiraceae bacterium]
MTEAFFQDNRDTLNRLTAFMLAYNQKVNLTRITEPADIREKHYLDSILPLTIYNVPRGTITLDVGSGAGFPGIPMKLFRPDLEITLLDSAKKRTDYLAAALREIGVNCAVITGRSEELAHDGELREGFGLVTARAVANLPALCEYCLPFVKVGGVFLAMKGENSEAASAKGAAKLLGGEIAEVKEYALTGGDRRSLAVIRKTSQTPANYPRKRVNIIKNPLGAF